MASISVVMPTYNRANYIGQALDSIGNQSQAPLEIIVVDDCSTDDTEEKINSHPLSSRIQYHRQTTNQGASVSRNTGVELARGDFVVFLDSDDLLEPIHHEVSLSILDRDKNLGLFCCDSWSIGPKGEWLNGHRSWTEVQCDIKQVRIKTGVRSIQEIFLFSTPFPGFTVRREIYRKIGGLDQSIFPLDDYDLQLKVAGTGYGVHYEHRPLARYRVHGDNESGRNQAVRVGEKKLRCLERALTRYPELLNLRHRVRYRIGEARRELALAMVRDRQVLRGTGHLIQSILQDPRGIEDLARIVKRKL